MICCLCWLLWCFVWYYVAACDIVCFLGCGLLAVFWCVFMLIVNC